MQLSDLAGLSSSFWEACLTILIHPPGRIGWGCVDNKKIAAFYAEGSINTPLVLIGHASAREFRAFLKSQIAFLQDIQEVWVLPVPMKRLGGTPPKFWTARILGLSPKIKVRVWENFIEEALQNANIRSKFAAWLSDDPLPLMLPEMQESWEHWLLTTMKEERYPRLDGRENDPSRVLLSKVFVDLPAGDTPAYLAHVLDLASSLSDMRSREQGRVGLAEVLIAGPGQGKTTLGQYACLIHRAALLKKERLDIKNAEVLTSVLEGTPLPKCRRLPFRIVLDRFARLLSEKKIKDVLEYIVYESERIESPLTFVQVEQAIKDVPTFWWFDGLDEVPSSANRSEVIAVLRSFFDKYAASSQICAIATTRPQGYQGELNLGAQHDIRSLELSNLPKEVARTYAEKLLVARSSDQPSRRKDILDRFDRALTLPETAALANSPLQVTILVTLLDRIGTPPGDRWELFQGYYQAIFDRERERGLAVNRVLEREAGLVRRLHAAVGYHLHVRAEGKDATDTLMSENDFREIAIGLWRSRGFDAQKAADLAEEICIASRDRLVFLVSPVAGFVGFEIRSLQEMFAAQRLIEGSEQQILDRLPVIAGISHWQNVFGFALGNIAANKDEVVPQLPEVLLRDEMGAAWCAIELIRGGITTRWPVIAEEVWGKVEIGETQPDPLIQLLFKSDVARASAYLFPMLQQGNPKVWGIVLGIGVNQFDDTWDLNVRQIWSELSFEEQGVILDNSESLDYVHQWGLAVLETVIWSRPWDYGTSISWKIKEIMGNPNSVMFCFKSVVYTKMKYAFIREISACDICFLGLLQNKNYHLDNFGLAVRQLPDILPLYAHPDWSLVIALGIFLREPTFTGLEKALAAIHPAASTYARSRLINIAPWPLAVCLVGMGIDVLISRGLRNEASWSDIESNWCMSGMSLDDALWLLSARAEIVSTALSPQMVRQIATVVKTKNDINLLKAIVYPIRYTSVYRVSHDHFQDVYNTLPELQDSFWEILLKNKSPELLVLFLIYRNHFKEDELDMLDKIGRLYTTDIFFSTLTYQSDELINHLEPKRPGLYTLVWPILSTSVPKSPKTLPRIPDLPAPLNITETLVRVYLALGETDSIELDAQLLAQAIVSKELPPGFDAFAKLPLNPTDTLLTTILKYLPADNNEAHTFVQGIRRRLWSNRPSGLGDAAIARRLELPIIAGVPLPEPERLTERIVLKDLWIKDFRGIRTLALTFAKPPSHQGQWIFLIGENGVGKTSVLRALTLTLAPATLVRDAHPHVRKEGTIVRNGEKAAQIKLMIENQPDRVVDISDTTVEARGVHPIPFLAAYGPRRGNTLQSGTSQPNYTAWEAIHSLFEPQPQLINVSIWLQRAKRLEDDSFGKNVIPTILTVITKLLPRVKKLDIDVRANKVYADWEDGSRVELESLSEGYLTTTSWVLDMMARWVEDRIKKPNPKPIPPNFNHYMTGVVLVDDIDLHLHPLWQWQLIDDLRKLFPALTFVVTTHNPVTLLGAQRGEIHVLRPGVAMAQQIDIPPGSDVSQVLTGGWFGMAADIDRDTLNLLESQRRLLNGKPGLNPQDNLENVESELRLRRNNRIETSADRLAIKVAAEVIDEDLRALTLEDKNRARDSIRQRLRERGLQ